MLKKPGAKLKKPGAELKEPGAELKELGVKKKQDVVATKGKFKLKKKDKDKDKGTKKDKVMKTDKAKKRKMSEAVKNWFKREHWRAWLDEKQYCKDKLGLDAEECRRRAGVAGRARTAFLREQLAQRKWPEGFPAKDID